MKRLLIVLILGLAVVVLGTHESKTLPKPMYLQSCTYDAQGHVISYTCSNEWSPDLCDIKNC
jgi:hypothetical protein